MGALHATMNISRDACCEHTQIIADGTRTLVEWGLVDEYHVAISPMLAGHGPTFLTGLPRSLTTALLSTSRLQSGVVIHRHRRG